ncbi:helix-turn-helix domain-containing protein (plasmid) [Paenibacillus sonchi]|uniref:Helix-turn-helix domain-containing protein n=1 Tax=Paenibacillus sonchi TaxID=373687 RepID=A0A974PJ50_9BACL|nr:helix-turn-helix domain-containing protein [Paenibacillus sonchi]QQZ64538.1 helix-turn-helix domain-containing protein [Paenibacillus sonchi]
MLEKNLKGTHHKLSYYRYRPTGVEEPKLRNVRDSEQTYTIKEMEKVYIKEEDVKRFSLDKHGQPIPYVDGHMTIISNYIYDYWGHFLSAEGVALYGHLKRYCYGDKDYCWPDLKLISQKMGKTRNTVKKYLSILEQYGFALMFNVQNSDKNNMEESPLYKIRKQVPFLPVELYEQLPPELKVDHDRYMQSITDQFDQIQDLASTVDYMDIYEDMLKSGKVLRKIKSPLERDKELLIKLKQLESKKTEQDKLIWADFIARIQKKVTKPVFDTWFKGTFCIKRDSLYTIYCPHSFIQSWLKERLHSLIFDTLREIDPEFKEINYTFIGQE